LKRITVLPDPRALRRHPRPNHHPNRIGSLLAFGLTLKGTAFNPQAVGSSRLPTTFDWMMGVQALTYKGGRHKHPKTLGPRKSVFDQAYSWFMANRPELLFSKANRDGFRFLTDPVSVFWALVEEDGRSVARIFVANA
jgi:hypothetical protein